MLTNDTLTDGSSTVDWPAESSARGQADGPAPWDTSDPFFSARARDIIMEVSQCYLRQIVIFMGIPGNVLCCVVFLKQGLSDRINLVLCSLAVADLVNLVAMLLRIPICYLDRLQAKNWDVISTAKFVYISLWAGYVSGIHITIISVDRCLSVVFPLKAGKLLTYRSMLAAILVTYVVHLACVLPYFLAFTVKWKVDPSTNHSMAYMAVTDMFAHDSGTPTLIMSYLSLSTKPFCLFLVVACCVITSVKLRRASHQRLQMTGKGKEAGDGGDTRITKMLLFLCLVYVVLTIPEVSSAITYYLLPGYFFYQKYHNSFVIVCLAVIDTSSCINSTVNFFAYVVMSSKFQRTLKELCPCFTVKAAESRSKKI